MSIGGDEIREARPPAPDPNEPTIDLEIHLVVKYRQRLQGRQVRRALKAVAAAAVTGLTIAVLHALGLSLRAL